MRISIRGTCGSGKSTLARSVAERTGIACVELDELFHLPGWLERPEDEFRALVGEALASEHWVVDGNYRHVREIVDANADTVVWLDYPFPLVFRRLFVRTLRRAATGASICNGNREDIRRSFTREGILWWCVTTYRRRRRQCDALFADPAFAAKTLVRCRRPRDADRWLATLTPPAAPPNR